MFPGQWCRTHISTLDHQRSGEDCNFNGFHLGDNKLFCHKQADYSTSTSPSIEVYQLFDNLMGLEFDYPIRISFNQREFNRLYSVVNYSYPMLHKAYYFDRNNNASVDAGDLLKLQFNRELMQIGALMPNHDFYISGGGYLGDSCSGILNPADSREILLTLGASAYFKIEGMHQPGIEFSDASGIQIQPSIKDRIRDLRTRTYHPVTIRTIHGFEPAIDIGVVFNRIDHSVDNLDEPVLISIPEEENSEFTQGGVEIPAGSLLSAVTVSLSPIPPEHGISSGFEFSAPGLNFHAGNPPILRIPYSESSINYADGYLEYGIGSFFQ